MNKFFKKHRPSIVDQSFLSLFLTFSLIEFTNRGSGIIDGLFVSNFLDADSIASVGIAKSIYAFIGIISGLLAVGMQSRCSHELGKGDVKNFNRIFNAMFYVSTVVSLLFGIVVFFGAKPMAVLMGASGNGSVLIKGAADYLRGIAIGIPPTIIAMMLSVACQLDNAQDRVRKSTLIYFVSDVVLDYVAIKLHLGVFGIAIATSVAYYLQLIFLLFHFKTKNRMLLFEEFNISPEELLNVLSLGTEKALRSLSTFISPVIVNRIILLFGGVIAMSAFSIQRDLINFTEIFASGLANATALQAGVYYGEKNSEAMREMGRSAHKYCALFLGFAALVLVFLSRPIAMMYLSERGELFKMVVFASVMTGLSAPFNGLIRSRISYLNSIGKVRNMQIMTFLSSIVYTVVSAFALGKLFSSYGILASDALRILLLMLTVWLYYVVKTKKVLPSPNDYLALPDTFIVHPGDIISLDIRDAEDVSLVSQQIQLICRGHRIDPKTEMKAALCFEELAVNIIQYGFPKCKKEPCIDLRLVIAEDELVIRLRDNCPMFDVERYIAQQLNDTREDGDPHLGLKMIASLSENIKYIHSLENNNVILRFERR